jgi:tRNA-splicing ligase RtcB
MITGKTLIDMGYEQAKWFGDVISYANTHNLTNYQIHQYIRQYIAPTISQKVYPPEKPINFRKYIMAVTEDEMDNVESVCAAMNNVLMTPTAVDAVIMPDACPTGKDEIPVGGVIATKNAIHPRMHSADICCSVMSTELGYTDPKTVLDAAFKITHFGVGGRSRENQLCPLPSKLKEKIESNSFLNNQKSLDYAHSHLGTQGDGNHFLFVGVSRNTGRTHIITHHGSRGFGANLYKIGVAKAESICKNIAPTVNPKNTWIPYDTDEGKEYWQALQIVREWTKLNHQCIHEAVAKSVSDIIPAPWNQFWNEHNFVFKDGDIFYHAKGATPMLDKFLPDSYEGMRLIPLNMGQPILIVKAHDNNNALGFAPHGAGRNFSRSQHMKRSLVNKSVDELFVEETKGLDIRFHSGKIDISELPSAYKNADNVKFQIEFFDLANIVDEIMPYGCIMAGHVDQPWRKK